MPATTTPTQVLAQAGLIQNQGLAIPPVLFSNITSYISTGITGNLHSLISLINSSALDNNLVEEIRLVMPGLAGIAHINNPKPGINANAVATSIGTRANLMYQNTKQFGSLVGQLQGFCAQSFEAAGAQKETASKSFQDYDFNIKNYGDVPSGGITNIFNPKRGSSGFTAGVENPSAISSTRIRDIRNIIRSENLDSEVEQLEINRLPATQTTVTTIIDPETGIKFETVDQSTVRAILGTDGSVSALTSNAIEARGISLTGRVGSSVFFDFDGDGLADRSALELTSQGYTARNVPVGAAIQSLSIAGLRELKNIKISGEYDFSDLDAGNVNVITKKVAAAESTEELKKNIKALAKGLRGLGNMYDATDMFAFGQPYGLIRSLQNQGLGDTTTLNARIANAGFNPSDLEFENQLELRAILRNITGEELQRIISTIGFTPPGSTRIATLEDLLEANKILPAESLISVRDENLDGLREQFITMGGKFGSMNEVANFLDGVEIANYGSLNDLTSPLPAEDAAAAAEAMPKGSGPFGNPTALELIGTAAGHVHIDSLVTILDEAAKFQTTSECQALEAAIANAVVAVSLGGASITYADNNLQSVIDAVDASVDETVMLALVNSTNAMKDIVNLLELEIENLEKADISLTTVSNTVSSVYSLVQSLPSIGQDENFKFKTLVERMVTPGKYGEAILASMQEGRIAARNEAANLRNLTKMDPENYARKLTGSAS
jgi:hypothetical protein